MSAKATSRKAILEWNECVSLYQWWSRYIKHNPWANLPALALHSAKQCVWDKRQISVFQARKALKTTQARWHLGLCHIITQLGNTIGFYLGLEPLHSLPESTEWLTALLPCVLIGKVGVWNRSVARCWWHDTEYGQLQLSRIFVWLSRTMPGTWVASRPAVISRSSSVTHQLGGRINKSVRVTLQLGPGIRREAPVSPPFSGRIRLQVRLPVSQSCTLEWSCWQVGSNSGHLTVTAHKRRCRETAQVTKSDLCYPCLFRAAQVVISNLIS